MIVSALFTLASYIYVACSLVSETTLIYTCKEGSQILKLENASIAINCEQSWAANSIPIGSFISGHAECHSPCINVTDGEIIIRGCVNATLTVICNQVHLTEFRRHYLGIQNNSLQDYKKIDHHRYGIYACGMLLLLIFVGFSIQHCRSHQCTVRNTGQNQI